MYTNVYLVRPWRSPRLEQFLDQDPDRADLEVLQAVPRDDGGREDVVPQVSRALGLVYLRGQVSIRT